MDTRIERGAQGGPVNRGREKVYVGNGRLSQSFAWSAPLQEWDVSHGVRSLAEFESLRALWYVVMFTPYSGFRFRDWSDYRATQANSRLTLITGATYQMQRLYTFGGSTFARDITKPCTSPAAVVYRTRSGSTTVATATIDTTTGIATISGHVAGDTYTWAGEFDIPVTFADATFPSTLECGEGVITQPIKLEEIRL